MALGMTIKLKFSYVFKNNKIFNRGENFVPKSNFVRKDTTSLNQPKRICGGGAWACVCALESGDINEENKM